MHRLRLTYDVLTTIGHFWCSVDPDLILKEDVIAWLESHDILFYIVYEDAELDEGCDHYIIFENHYDSVNFKMRWS